MTHGAPSKYRPEMCEEVIAFMKDGDSKEAVCARLGIGRTCFYDWCDPESTRYKPEFAAAVEEGMLYGQAFWEDELKKAAIGKNPDANATLMIFNMKNRFREQWSDHQVHEQRHSFVVSDEPVDNSDEWLENHKPK